MKKIFAVALAAALSLTVLAGCGENNNNNNNNNNANNSAPAIEGVKEQDTIMAGEEWDALEGVTATDKEDGDLTSKIEVSASGLTFTNGKTTPTEASEYTGYEIIYTVKDSGGKTATEYCTLYVKQAAQELENVFTADFTTPTAGETDSHYWDKVIDGPEATATLKEGAYVFDVTDLKGAGDDKLMLTRHFGDLTVGEYKVVVWAGSSVNTKINMQALLDDADAATNTWDGKNLGKGNDDNYATGDAPHGLYGAEVGTTVKPITLEFSLTDKKINKEKVGILFRICLGGNDNPAQFKFSIEKIAIYKTTGTESKESLKSADYKTSVEGLYPNDHAVVTQGTEGADIAITYDDANNADWYSQVAIGLPELEITKGEKYYYTFKVKATAEIAELIVCVEDSLKGWEMRDSYHSFSLAANEEKTIEMAFVAGEGQDKAANLTDAVCRLYLGKHENGVASNKLTLISFDFGKVNGNKTTDRVAQDKFVLFGEDSSNKTNSKYPFAVYNGSDDNLANKGIGTAYVEGGKLVYKIHEGSTEGGQNKLVIGFWDNPIALPANAYYVVSFKVKASAAIGMDVCFHDMDCGSDWDSGLLYRRAHFQKDPVQIGTTETEVSFTTEVVYKESKCELILEFGSAELAKLTGDVTIEISEIKIGVQKLAN